MRSEMPTLTGVTTPDLITPPADIADERDRMAEVLARLDELGSRMAMELDRLEAVLRATHDGIAMFDLGGNIILANARFAAFFGLEADGFVGKSASEARAILASRVREPGAFAEQFDRMHAHPEAVCESLIEVEVPEPRILLQTTTPIRTQWGRIIGRTTTVRDVTKEREVDRMKSEFVSMVSHELRTPLTSIKGGLQLLLARDEELAPLQKELLELCQRNTERLIRLVNDILDIAKIEAGKTELRLAEASLADLAEAATASVRSFADDRRVALRMTIGKELPPIEVDPDRLVQVLVNLLANAIKFSPEGSEVLLEATCVEAAASGSHSVLSPQSSVLASRAVEIAVRDRGHGIAAEDQAQLFRKFQQLRHRNESAKGGTGLGLAICKGIVEQHGGRIWVESVPGEGARFAFRIPLRQRATGR